MDTILFDTETTGLLKPQISKISAQPYIIEIYACRIDDNFKLVGEYEAYIKPPIELSEEITRITGITETDLKDAKPFIHHIKPLQELFLGVEKMVAHNLPFDRSMLANELVREDMILNFPWPSKHICTVEKSLPLFGHRLSLAKLHQALFNKDFKDAHRAKNDVYALVRCYKEMINQGLI